MIVLKSSRELELMKEACQISAEALMVAGEAVKPGASTKEIDEIAYKFIKKHGATPNFLNYGGFPATACISINDEVIHGIPKADRILKEGDIVSLDAGLIYEGYHSDAARTWAVGNVSPEAQKLMDVTKQCFYEGIKFAKAGNHLNDISTAIQAYAEKFGYGVVRELVGHGIGTHLHEDPEVPNFATKRRGILLQPGMTLAIEPMINAGTPDVIWMDDDWTVVTADHALSAHYENTILITEGEPEILSLRPGLE
mgnify:CR=1 FL=1